MGFFTNYDIFLRLKKKYTEEEIQEELILAQRLKIENKEELPHDEPFTLEALDIENISEENICEVKVSIGLKYGNFKFLQYLASLFQLAFQVDLMYLSGEMFGEVLEVEKGTEFEIFIYKSNDSFNQERLEEEIKDLRIEKEFLEKKLKSLESKYIELFAPKK